MKQMMSKNQVSIVGASVAGLLAATEAAERGIETTVYEEHREIGLPEKCDGLVSAKGMSELGLVPPANIVQNHPTKAVFFSPSKKEIRIDAHRQNVVVLDRARFDRYLAEKALRAGAKIELGRRVSKTLQTPVRAQLKIDSNDVESEVILDCSGHESYIRSGGETLQGGLYLVQGNWFEKSTVEVYFDPKAAPGFFYWVIPIADDIAKIGIAGSEVNTFSALDEFVERMKARPLRKMAAPVVCSGTLRQFVDGRIARAGDAAGQAKPTTGGGIYTGGFGGALAGIATAEAVQKKSIRYLENYELNWKEKFGREFRLQYLARNAFSKMSSEQIDKLFEMIGSSEIPRLISEEGDFDRHSVAITKAFGFSNSLSALGMLFSNELRNLLS